MMTKNPKISVIMPTYNGKKYIKYAIESILNQTYEDFELIIVNDCSTDNTEEIILSFLDKRIKYYRNSQNLGIAETINKAISLAKSDFIAQHDHDDVSESQRLEMQVDYLNRSPDVYLIGTDYHIIDGKGKRLTSVKQYHDYPEIKNKMMETNCFCHGSIMYKKELVHKIGLYRKEFRYTMDYDFLLRIIEKYKILNLPYTLYSLRRGIDCSSTRNLIEQLDTHLLSVELAKERRRSGEDSLAQINQTNICAELVERYNLKIEDINEFKADYIMNYFKLATQRKSYFSSLKYFLMILKLSPKKWRIRYCFSYFFSSHTK